MEQVLNWRLSRKPLAKTVPNGDKRLDALDDDAIVGTF